MKKTVIVQFDIEGFHCYPNAPAEVHFLSHEHRHTFTVKVGYTVTDSNREKEIFLCRDEIKEYLNSDGKRYSLKIGKMSKESLGLYYF